MYTGEFQRLADIISRRRLRTVGVTTIATCILAGTTVAIQAQSMGPTNAALTAATVAGQAAAADTYDESLVEALGARITAGAVFFNEMPRLVRGTVTKNGEQRPTATFESAEFSQASYYLAFEAQPRLVGRRRPQEGDGHRRFYLEPFVNVRLTTIPVAGPPQVDAGVGGEETGSSGSIGASSLRAPAGALLQSRKAAQVQFGTVASFNFGKFTIKKSTFHWGIGPMFRVGLQSVTDAQRTLRVWNIADDLYDAWTTGLRFTLYGRRDSSRWMPSAYLDISRGKFQNFEFPSGSATSDARGCLAIPRECLAKGPPAKDQFGLQKRWRWYIEGRVFFQRLYLGFDINNGHGRDDLRFSAGYTIPLTELAN